MPDIVFESSMVIELENGRIELEHVGGNHAEDSIIVKVPEACLMFIGDCFYPPPCHLLKGGETISISMLADLESDQYDLYIEGHDEPFNRDELIHFLAQNSQK